MSIPSSSIDALVLIGNCSEGGTNKSIVIGGDTYRLEVFRYIHWNPQKASLEVDFSLYRWSSYQAYFSRTSGTDWISRDLILEHFQGKEKAVDRSATFS